MLKNSNIGRGKLPLLRSQFGKRWRHLLLLCLWHIFFVKQGLLVVGGRNLFTKRDLPTAEFYLPSNKNWTKMRTPGYKYFNRYFHMIVNFAPDNLSQDDERHESSSVGSASSCDWGRGNSEKLDGSH